MLRVQYVYVVTEPTIIIISLAPKSLYVFFLSDIIGMFDEHLSKS